MYIKYILLIIIWMQHTYIHICTLLLLKGFNYILISIGLRSIIKYSIQKINRAISWFIHNEWLNFLFLFWVNKFSRAHDEFNLSNDIEFNWKLDKWIFSATISKRHGATMQNESSPIFNNTSCTVRPVKFMTLN